MSTRVGLLVVRFVSLLVMGLGFLALGREQRVTAGRGGRLRPRFIALWIGLTLVGAGISVAAILAE